MITAAMMVVRYFEYLSHISKSQESREIEDHNADAVIPCSVASHAMETPLVERVAYRPTIAQ